MGQTGRLSRTDRPIAIGARLQVSEKIDTLGFRPDFNEYTHQEQARIWGAPKIYFPTAFYSGLFNTMGIQTFPSHHTYQFAQDKIKQTAAFSMMQIPHPKTKVFYGPRQYKTILDHFQFPFIAKIPRGSGKGAGVSLIRNEGDLAIYLENPFPAYIQEYLPIDRDMRIIVIGKKIRLAFWRRSGQHTFKTNLSQGGRISFDPLPPEALELALRTAEKCGWDDIGIDIIEHKGRLYVLEGNVKYGTKGFKAAGIDYKHLLESLILTGEI